MMSALTSVLRPVRDGYTGPLVTSARYATRDLPGVVIFTGFAHDVSQEPGTPPLRVRMEMSPEDAEDLLRVLHLKIRAARESPR
jgi:hypothetical protein